MNNFFKDITFIIVSFQSEKVIDTCIDSLNSVSKILVIENSNNHLIKQNLEKKYSNLQVKIVGKNLGYSKAFYGEGFSNITSNSILCSIEAGFKYIIMKTVSANIYGGYNILTGNGINGLGTIYPIYSGVSLNWLLSTKSKTIQK